MDKQATSLSQEAAHVPSPHFTTPGGRVPILCVPLTRGCAAFKRQPGEHAPRQTTSKPLLIHLWQLSKY